LEGAFVGSGAASVLVSVDFFIVFFLVVFFLAPFFLIDGKRG